MGAWRGEGNAPQAYLVGLFPHMNGRACYYIFSRKKVVEVTASLRKVSGCGGLFGGLDVSKQKEKKKYPSAM